MSSARRPLIGVSGPDAGGAAAWVATRWAVYRAGGRAVRLTPVAPDSEEPLNGLILGGGADIEPSLYGATGEPRPKVTRRDQSLARNLFALVFFPLLLVVRRTLSVARAPAEDPGRDQLEYALLESALARDLPVLGVCRGAQLLNVYCGGTLHADLAQFYVEVPELRTLLPRKPVRLEPDSCLAAITGRTELRVNAMHRQAVDRLGDDIRIAGAEPNGVVQAIEHAGRRFVIGVQWHPEYLPQEAAQRAIFRALVDAAAQRGPTS